MLNEILYATNNSGKIAEVSKLFNYHEIQVLSPQDLKIDLDVPETGNTLEENAILKVTAFSKVSNGRIVVADDTGLEIDALGGKPGIHVRRWRDGITQMTDEEIIDYCLDQMQAVPPDQRGAQFKTVLALGLPTGEVEIFDGILRGVIREKVADIKVKGFPFESLFFISDWNMLLGEVHQLKASEKGHRLNHRERALQKAIPRIKELFEG